MGGITSSIHRLAVETRIGTRTQVVLRQWTPSVWDTTADAPQFVERERHVLRGLESTDIPAPRVLAVDPTGESTGVPALLMTRVPGRKDLTPTDPKAWLRQIAGMAARIHELDVDAEPYWWKKRDVPVPPWASRPADWRAAADLVRGPAPAHEVRFAHGDYQHFNFLWQRGRLTGVVDWVVACRGPADVDVGHCRLNLAVLYSAELAAAFLPPTKPTRAGASIRIGTSDVRPRPRSVTGRRSSRSRSAAALGSTAPGCTAASTTSLRPRCEGPRRRSTRGARCTASRRGVPMCPSPSLGRSQQLVSIRRTRAATPLVHGGVPPRSDGTIPRQTAPNDRGET